MQRLAYLAVAGAAGTLARYGLQGWVQAWRPGVFPWGTLAVNVLGCLAFGAVWALSEDRLVITAETRLIALAGFMGAFTTWSSYVFEVGEMLRAGRTALAAGYLATQHGLGFAAFFGGLALGRRF